jgi:3',5'-cyclic-AMP phosphodiesterase
MRIVQISDLHIVDLIKHNQGVDTATHFLKALDKAASLSPDHLVITGDICHSHPRATYGAPKAEVYQWVYSKLQETKIDFTVIPGNHDDGAMMAVLLGEKPIDEEYYFLKNIGGNEAVFLDTNEGDMSAKQLMWFEEVLKNGNVQFIFMHYPPCIVGAKFMDTHFSFKQMDEVQLLLKKISRPLYIFTGHYHTERTICIGHHTVFVTPSCFNIIDDMAETLVTRPNVPVIRIVDIGDGEVRTVVR